MSHKEFSVLMSLYHAEKADYLHDCFSSLYEQSYKAKQIVLVLDGPISNELLSVVDNWRGKFSDFCLVPLEFNVGLGKALNIGLDKCKYDLVARVDTDDINARNRFEMQVDIFEKYRDISLCGSQIEEIECESQQFISMRKVAEFNDEVIKDSVIRCPFNHMTVMFKKEAVLSVGGYKHMPSMEDWYLWLRLLANGHKGYNIQKPLVRARTGIQMMERRSGFKYVKSEFRITKVKLKLFPQYRLKSIMIFFARALPRLLPKKMLNVIYIWSRRTSG